MTSRHWKLAYWSACFALLCCLFIENMDGAVRFDKPSWLPLTAHCDSRFACRSIHRMPQWLSGYKIHLVGGRPSLWSRIVNVTFKNRNESQELLVASSIRFRCPIGDLRFTWCWSERIGRPWCRLSRPYSKFRSEFTRFSQWQIGDWVTWVGASNIGIVMLGLVTSKKNFCSYTYAIVRNSVVQLCHWICNWSKFRLPWVVLRKAEFTIKWSGGSYCMLADITHKILW